MTNKINFKLIQYEYNNQIEVNITAVSTACTFGAVTKIGSE